MVYEVFKTSIRRNEALNQAAMVQKSIFEFSKNSNGARDYADLVQEILR